MIPRAILIVFLFTFVVAGAFWSSRSTDELIVNGSFERSDIGVGPMTSGAWDLGGPTTAIIQDSKHCYDGKKCGALTALNSGSYTITQRFTGMTANATYVLQYRYKNLSEKPVHACSMAARLDGATTNEHMVLADCKAGFQANAKGEYEHALVSRTFVAAESDGYLQFFLLCIGDSFTVVFDDVSVKPIKSEYARR